MCTGSVSGSDSESGSNGLSKAPGVVLKALVLIGVFEGASFEGPGELFQFEMAFLPSCRNGGWFKGLYFEQAFWRTPHKPFRQRFFMVKPCSKEMKCDVELSTYAIRDSEEYRNFCDRSKDQRPQPEEVIGDIAEHLTTIYLKRCDRGKRCLYEGSTPPDGYPNTWNGASYCTSELTVLKNSEIHKWDRGYDNDGNQVWGVKGGAYEFKTGSSIKF
ncbi:UNVERIFIED_CONTAM: Chromophore lyase CRL, chloroplastic [Sesamum calycinum]|uniref:Chromophore lyase CRL, chloroplastic n=1 Tax=Sesamum calycinum TaxID=2727403 RepID=A0AAW2NH30_9LAMI